MKLSNFLFAFFLIFSLNANAQKGKSRAEKEQYKINLKYFNEIFGNKDKDFDIMKSPEQWIKEPVVILCQKIHISFSKKPNKKDNATKGVVRKRILIQDKAALEDFSEFYYQEALAFGIQHIKPDGTTHDIDMQSAVKVETEVPRFYSSSYSSEEYYKIAVPNLEVGDILDYFKVFTQDYASNIELINPVSQVYPTNYQEIIFDVKAWSFFYNSFNGAPEFKMEKLKNAKGKETGVKRFILRDKNREAMKDERWSYTYLAEPTYKIMAIPPKGGIGNKRINKETINNSFNVKSVFNAVINNGENIVKESSIFTLLKASLKKAGIKKMLPQQKVDLIYHGLRKEFISQNARYYNNTNVLSLESDYSNYVMMRNDIFTALFIKTLEKHKINAHAVVIIPRYYGGVDDVVTEDEMEFGVYVPLTKKYYWTVDNYRSSIDPFAKTYGAQGYMFNEKDQSFKPITIPESKPEENISATEMEISINEEDNSLIVVGGKQYTGDYKDYFSPLLLYQTVFIKEDWYYMSSEKGKAEFDKEDAKKGKEQTKKSKGNKRVRAYREKLKKRAEELSERKQEILKDWLSGNFELEELNSFTVTSFGRFPEKNTLEAAFEFSSKGYLKKAGPNLIFEAGKLITGQVELTEKEINERKGAIDLSYARIIKNEISVILPEGYTAQGIEALNYNVDNPYAAFISEASQDGNTLLISTSKIYKKQHIEKENWKGMVDMLEAAYDFSQKKIILKK